MPPLVLRRPRVLVIPCDRDRRCFRWVVTSAQGRQERSTYAFATAMGARLVGEVRVQEIDAKV